MKITFKLLIISLIVSNCLLLAGCNTSDDLSAMPASQKRINETRFFEATNKNYLLKAVITTLQDQGYNIVKINLDSSEVTAQRDSNIILSTIIYPVGTNQFAVRTNGQIFKRDNFSSTGYENITDPQFYQKELFEPLSKSIFLQKQNL